MKLCLRCFGLITLGHHHMLAAFPQSFIIVCARAIIFWSCLLTDSTSILATKRSFRMLPGLWRMFRKGTPLNTSLLSSFVEQPKEMVSAFTVFSLFVCFYMFTHIFKNYCCGPIFNYCFGTKFSYFLIARILCWIVDDLCLSR